MKIEKPRQLLLLSASISALLFTSPGFAAEEYDGRLQQGMVADVTIFDPETIDIDDSSIKPSVEAQRRSHPEGSNPQSRAVPQRAMPATDPSANAPGGGLFASTPDGLSAWFGCETHSGNGGDAHDHGHE